MANTGFKGVDVRQTGSQLVFRSLFQDSTGALLTSGTTNIRLFEIQSDGSLKTYDWSSNTFKASGMSGGGAEKSTMTHQQGLDASDVALDTGVWTKVLSTLTGFTAGAMYLVGTSNSGASPVHQYREFMYGSAEGDLLTSAVSTGVANVAVDLHRWKGSIPNSLTSNGNVQSSLVEILTTALTETSGYLAAGFKKFFNIQTPVSTVGSVDQTGDNYARLGGPAGPSVSADIAAVNAKTTNLPSDPADQSIILAATDAILAAIPSANTVRDAVWNATTASLTTVNSIGKRLVDLFSGITSLASWLGALAGKTADSSTQTEIRATTAGAGYTITTDSLEAIRDNQSGGSGDVTVSVVIPEVVAQASQTPAQITCIRGDKLVVDLPEMGDLTGYEEIWFTVKKVEILDDPDDTDADALIQVTLTQGLVVLNQSDTGFDAGDASLAILDASDGTTRLTVAAVITKQLAIGDYAWDGQFKKTSGDNVQTPISGVFAVTSDVTQAV